MIEPELEDEDIEFMPDDDQPDSRMIEDLIVSGEFKSERFWRGEVAMKWSVPLTGANPQRNENRY